MTYHPSTMLLPTAATMPNRDKTVANHDATTTNRGATAAQPRRAPANTGVPWRNNGTTVASTGATVASHDATLAQQPYNYNNKWKIKHRHDIILPYTNNNTSLKHHTSSLDHIHIAR